MAAVVCLVYFRLQGNKPSFTNGDYKSNMSDFLNPIIYNEEATIVDCYFQNVRYSVAEINENDKLITLNVSIPDFVTILNETINENYNDDSTNYETLLKLIKEKIEDKINDSSHPEINKRIIMSIDKDDNGKWKMIPSDEFYDFIFEPIIKAMEE